jgi:hypothetical protein
LFHSCWNLTDWKKEGLFHIEPTVIKIESPEEGDHHQEVLAFLHRLTPDFHDGRYWDRINDHCRVNWTRRRLNKLPCCNLCATYNKKGLQNLTVTP